MDVPNSHAVNPVKFVSDKIFLFLLTDYYAKKQHLDEARTSLEKR